MLGLGADYGELDGPNFLCPRTGRVRANTVRRVPQISRAEHVSSMEAPGAKITRRRQGAVPATYVALLRRCSDAATGRRP